MPVCPPSQSSRWQHLRPGHRFGAAGAPECHAGSGRCRLWTADLEGSSAARPGIPAQHTCQPEPVIQGAVLVPGQPEGGQACQPWAKPTNPLCSSRQTQPGSFGAGFTRFCNHCPQAGLVSRSQELHTMCGQWPPTAFPSRKPSVGDRARMAGQEEGGPPGSARRGNSPGLCPPPGPQAAHGSPTALSYASCPIPHPRDGASVLHGRQDQLAAM